ncbi:hypothetical protein ACFWIB_41265, partial [Streptomyces sp. NPDC127051]|uniref:hypothetical protein n=1 Tax=Streptomyces sp. NPDC127051 TaxID=3347119 RepID=UPI0036619898
AQLGSTACEFESPYTRYAEHDQIIKRNVKDQYINEHFQPAHRSGNGRHPFPQVTGIQADALKPKSKCSIRSPLMIYTHKRLLVSLADGGARL